MSLSRIKGLDGLRGLAAFAVILHHTLIKGTDIGGLSVFMFFVLSGFLITGILARMRAAVERGKTTIGVALGEFWIQRALRIFPAYYVWLGLFFVADSVWFDGRTLPEWPWYVTYTQNFLIGFKTFAWKEFTHTWSLAVEQQYYAFFAPLILLIPSRWHIRFLIGALAACAVAIVSLQHAGFQSISLYISPATGFIMMACGALIAIRRQGQSAGNARAEPSGARLAALARPLVAGPAALVAALVLVGLLAYVPVAERVNGIYLPYLVIVGGSAYALSVVMIAVLNNPASIAVGVLETKLFRFFGRISYSLYIVHLPVGEWVYKYLDVEALGGRVGLAGDTVAFAIVAPVSILLAWASYWLVEKRFLDLKSRFRATPDVTQPAAKANPAAA